MKVNITKWNMIRRCIEWISNDLDIDITTMNDDIFDVKGANAQLFGINWKCMGTKPITTAKLYADYLYRAAEIAEFLNGCEFRVDYTSKFEFDDNNRDEWTRLMDKLKYAIRDRKLDVVWDFVEHVDVNGNC